MNKNKYNESQTFRGVEIRVQNSHAIQTLGNQEEPAICKQF